MRDLTPHDGRTVGTRAVTSSAIAHHFWRETPTNAIYVLIERPKRNKQTKKEKYTPVLIDETKTKRITAPTLHDVH